MTPLHYLLLGQMAIITYLIWQRSLLQNKLVEAMATAQNILDDYQKCITLAKEENERASYYCQKYLALAGGEKAEYGKVNTGTTSGDNGPVQ